MYTKVYPKVAPMLQSGGYCSTKKNTEKTQTKDKKQQQEKKMMNKKVKVNRLGVVDQTSSD